MKRRLLSYGLLLTAAVIISLGGDCETDPGPIDGEPVWRFYEPPIGADYYCVDGSGRHDVWMVGRNSNSNGVALHFDGISVKTAMPPTGTGALYVVRDYDYNNVWAGGIDQRLYHYNGTDWERWDSPISDVYGIDFGRIDFGFAVGSGGAMAQFDGNFWTTIESPVTADLRAINFVSEDEAWAAGLSGTVLHYVGGEWQIVDPGTDEDLYGLDFVSPESGWFCGSNGTILRYQSGTFTAQTVPFTDVTYNDVCMVNETFGWAGGESRRLIGYSDGIWDSIDMLPSGVWRVLSIDVRAKDEAWAVGEFGEGGLILHYR